MSHNSDLEFVTQLRGMAATPPVIAVPAAATIVRAGRSRKARNHSVFAGAFGVALLAGAGFTMLPQTVGNSQLEVEAPVAAITHVEPLVRGVEPMTTRLPEAAVGLEAGEAFDAIAPTEAVVPGTETEQYVEAGGTTTAHAISPWAAGLGIAGAASLGTAAGLAVRSRRIQAAPVRVRV